MKYRKLTENGDYAFGRGGATPRKPWGRPS